MFDTQTVNVTSVNGASRKKQNVLTSTTPGRRNLHRFLVPIASCQTSSAANPKSLRRRNSRPLRNRSAATSIRAKPDDQHGRLAISCPTPTLARFSRRRSFAGTPENDAIVRPAPYRVFSRYFPIGTRVFATVSRWESGETMQTVFARRTAEPTLGKGRRRNIPEAGVRPRCDWSRRRKTSYTDNCELICGRDARFRGGWNVKVNWVGCGFNNGLECR